VSAESWVLLFWLASGRSKATVSALPSDPPMEPVLDSLSARALAMSWAQRWHLAAAVSAPVLGQWLDLEWVLESVP
jgi:hypothetical protein